jgi:lysophospholipase L1-like esterase
MRRTAGVLVALALLVSGLVTSVAAPASAAPAPTAVRAKTYVALGDSYAAGYGLPGPTDPASVACARSSLAYPQLLRHFRNLRDVTFVACSGATTFDVQNDQLSVLSEDTTTVTLTVGGNDAGFASLVCLQDASCDAAAIQQRAAAALAALAGGPAAIGATGDPVVSLASLLAQIHARAPRATIFVTGYPELFGTAPTLYGTDTACPVPLGFRLLVNELAVQLNTVIRATARAARQSGIKVVYVSVTKLFDGHGLCDTRAPLISTVLHPTVAGQLAYAAALVRRGVAR